MVKIEKSLTVGQLIALLSKYPSTKEVITEGCDCFGIAADAFLITDNSSCDYDKVIIARTTDLRNQYKTPEESASDINDKNW